MADPGREALGGACRRAWWAWGGAIVLAVVAVATSAAGLFVEEVCGGVVVVGLGVERGVPLGGWPGPLGWPTRARRVEHICARPLGCGLVPGWGQGVKSGP